MMEQRSSITLDVNGEELEIKTHAHTVGNLLSEQDIDIAENDLVTPSVNTSIVDGLSIRWEQSKQVAIIVGQDTMSLWTTKSTVDEVLEEASIEISEHDNVTPGLHQQLGDDNVITVQKRMKLRYWTGGQRRSFGRLRLRSLTF